MVLRKKGIPWIYDGVPLSFFIVYVMNEIQFQVALIAPIKRPLSRENTSPSQKMMSFILQGQIQFRRKSFLLSAPCQ
jgi:hypothetical protein